MSEIVESLRSRYSYSSRRDLRAGAEALHEFLRERNGALQTLTAQGFRTFCEQVRQTHAGKHAAVSLLKGARCYLRVMAERGAVDASALMDVLGRHAREGCVWTSAQRVAFGEARRFRESLRWLAPHTRGHMERGARALLLFLAARTKRPADITSPDWDAFRAAVYDRSPRALFAVSDGTRSGIIVGARSYLEWKAEQGEIRADQVYAAPRGHFAQQVELPPSLDALRDKMREALDVADFSVTARASYSRAVRDFLVWLDGQGIADIAEARRDVMTAYVLHIQKHESQRGKPYSTSTQISILAALRFFFAWLVRTGVLLSDPTIHLRYPRQGIRLPRPIEVKEAARLLRSFQETPIGRRDRAIVELLYGTGLRRAELAKLVLSDVNFDERTILVRQGKGRKDRIVPFGKKAKAALVDYLENARDQFVRRPTTVIFLSHWGRPMNLSYLGFRVVTMGKRIGLKVSSHMLRHSCATHLLKGRADIRHIQRLLGHETLATTEKYTKVEVGDLKEVLKRCHPRERGRV